MCRHQRKQLLPLVFLGSLLGSLPHFGADDNSDSHFRRASQMAQEGKIDAAISEYHLGLKQAPNAYDAYNNLGTLYFQKQDFQKAAAAYRDADRLRPRDPEISFNLGLALLKSGDFNAAIPYLVLGTEFKARSIDAHYLLGLCYYDLKDWKQAIQKLEWARQSQPSRAEILYLLVEAYRNHREPEKAIGDFAELLRSNPDSP